MPFFSISGSEFVEMFVGVGASRVRDLFKKVLAAARHGGMSCDEQRERQKPCFHREVVLRSTAMQ